MYLPFTRTLQHKATIQIKIAFTQQIKIQRGFHPPLHTESQTLPPLQLQTNEQAPHLSSTRSTCHPQGTGTTACIGVTVPQNTLKSQVTFVLQTPTEVRRNYKAYYSSTAEK